MVETAWVCLTATEKTLLLEALRSLAASRKTNFRKMETLAIKISQGKAHPDITIGVYGGQVQWAVGHPFPIRIRDYDGEEDELPDVDEQGQRCRTWFEFPDTKTNA
jgi:hypothetical protein